MLRDLLPATGELSRVQLLPWAAARTRLAVPKHVAWAMEGAQDLLFASLTAEVIFFSDADGRDDVDHVAMLALLGKQDTLLLKDDADQDDDEDVDDDHHPNNQMVRAGEGKVTIVMTMMMKTTMTAIMKKMITLSLCSSQLARAGAGVRLARSVTRSSPT